jgi:hypothetical protein
LLSGGTSEEAPDLKKYLKMLQNYIQFILEEQKKDYFQYEKIEFNLVNNVPFKFIKLSTNLRSKVTIKVDDYREKAST